MGPYLVYTVLPRVIFRLIYFRCEAESEVFGLLLHTGPILRAPGFLSQQSLNMRSLTLSMCISRGLLVRSNGLWLRFFLIYREHRSPFAPCAKQRAELVSVPRFRDHYVKVTMTVTQNVLQCEICCVQDFIKTNWLPIRCRTCRCCQLLSSK